MKKIFSIIMSVLMIACFMPSMAFANPEPAETTSIDLDTFIKWLEDNEYTVDGSQYGANTAAVQDGKLNVAWSPESGCFQLAQNLDSNHGLGTNCPRTAATGNTPNRVNAGYAQYQLCKNATTAVTIKNVNFVYTPAGFKECANSDWADSSNATIPAELQFENDSNTTLIDCTFEKVGVSIWNEDADNIGIVKNCKFKKINASYFTEKNYGDYAISYLRSGKVYISGNTFEEVCRGMMVYAPNNTEAYIVNNDFSGVADSEAMIKVDGTKTDTKLVVFGNTDTGNRGTVCRMINNIMIHTGAEDNITYTENSTNKNISVANIGSVGVTSDGVVTSTVLTVAKIVKNSATTEYETLAAAIAAAETGDTIILLRDVTIASPERLTIDTDKTFTIDLGGNTLTGRTDIKHGNVTIKNGVVTNSTQPLNVYGSTELTAENYSVLTISEDVDVSATENVVCMMNAEDKKTYGAVINVEGDITATGEGNDAAVFVSGNIGHADSNVDIKAMSENNIINITGRIVGGNIMAVAMNGQATVNVKASAEISGATGIGVKRGILNVEDGATVKATGEKVDPVTANMNGAENTGAAISVTSSYNAYGAISINVNGGTIESEENAAFYIGHSKSGTNSLAFGKGMTVSLAGGNFAGGADGAIFVADRINDDAESYTKAVVSGGVFSSDPTAYCASGKTGKASGNGDYPFTVGDVQKEVKVEIAKTEAKSVTIETEGKTDEEKKEIEKVNSAITEAATNMANTTATGLEATAATEASKITETEVTEAKSTLETELKKADASATVESVNIFVQPYLDITVAGAKVETAETEAAQTIELTLEIKPMVKTIATTASTAAEIVTAAEADSSSGKSTNAVEIGEAKETTVTTPVTITIPLPTGFVSSTVNELYVKHTKSTGASYVYTAAVSGDGDNGFKATFTNPNGFSEFVLTKDDASVAKIDGVGYTTLQAAVNAAEDGDTITVLKDGSATMSGSSRTIKFANGGSDSTNIKVTINGKEMTLNTYSNAQSFTYTAPSGGRGGYVAPTTDDTKTDEQVKAENAAKAAELTKALSLKARSTKTAKGNIKVTLTVDKDAIQAIEDLGYTVKYKFYRSTKKAASYKAALEKTGKTYTNTAGKKGTKYYYKARVMVYDAQGKLIAKSALTQCRYACRVR